MQPTTYEAKSLLISIKRILRKGLYKIVVERDISAIAKETVGFNNDPE